MTPLVGVLALQGDFTEHVTALQRAGVRTREVRLERDLVYATRMLDYDPRLWAALAKVRKALDDRAGAREAEARMASLRPVERSVPASIHATKQKKKTAIR